MDTAGMQVDTKPACSWHLASVEGGGGDRGKGQERNSPHGARKPWWGPQEAEKLSWHQNALNNYIRLFREKTGYRVRWAWGALGWLQQPHWGGQLVLFHLEVLPRWAEAGYGARLFPTNCVSNSTLACIQQYTRVSRKDAHFNKDQKSQNPEGSWN